MGDCTNCLANTNERLNMLAEEVYNLRTLLYWSGQRLKGNILDDCELEILGEQLIAESKFCVYCDGTGEDGDECGGSYACYVCFGKGTVEAINSETHKQRKSTFCMECGAPAVKGRPGCSCSA